MMKQSLVVVLACMLALVGCRDSGNDHGHPHSPGEKEHAHEAEKKDEHNQPPPHGGTVVKLGSHGFNLELIQDSEAGKLQAHVLDAHMEFVPVPETSFSIVANVNGKQEYLTFERVAPDAGAIPEKSSLFEAKAEWLKTSKAFDGLIPQITLAGKSFTNLLFTFPKNSAR